MKLFSGWNQLKIRTQLVTFMTLLVSILEAGTLLVINQLDKQDSQHFAMEVVQTVTTSLNNDLLQAPLAPSAVTFADINHRMSGFKQIRGMVILDEQQQAILHYGEIDTVSAKQQALQDTAFIFDNHNLYSRTPIVSEGHTFGFTLLNVDLTEYRNRQLQNVWALLTIFPITLIAGFMVSWVLSLNFTRPFSRLAQAMAQSDFQQGQYVEVRGGAKNEVGQLFNGYNQMLDKIDSTTKALRFQSQHDALTGLYNRFYIEDEINRVLLDESNPNSALIMLDLDQFNIVNDSAGFLAGDDLLKMFAHHCLNHLPEASSLARIGGDDFYILIEHINASSLKQLMQKLVDELHDFRFSWEGQAYSVSASMGAVLFKPNQYTQQALIKSVHYAFHLAKAKGRSKFEVYLEGEQSSDLYHQDATMARSIKEALSDGPARFELFAQPIVPLQEKSDQCSYEILLRMWGSEGEFISPGAFLPTAERYQLMTEIDMFVLWTYLEQVCQQPQHLENLHVAHVNLSGTSLNHPDFQNKLKEAIKHFDFPWQKLELEVTETSAVGNFNHARSFIDFCKNQGIGLALDDFGTGMSSFEYLKSLPFDVVKIDGSFVKDMHTDPTDKAVIRYIQEISALRQQETIAEYVETQEDVDVLRDIGITYGQGYHLGKPKPLLDWFPKSR